MKVLQEMINYLKSLNKFFKKNHYVKTMMMTMMTNLRLTDEAPRGSAENIPLVPEIHILSLIPIHTSTQ